MRAFLASSAIAIALSASACAGGDRNASTTVYFLSADRSSPAGVTRPGALSARDTLRVLIKGPSREEARRGISTAIPPRTEVRAFRVDGGNAWISFSGLPDPAAAERFRIITQLTKSLTGRSGVRRLWFRSDGKPWGLWRRSGGILEGPYVDGACTTVGTGAPGTEAVVADSFSSC